MKKRQRAGKNGKDYMAPTLDPALTARICWYHFREGQTQQEIADRIGLSRVTINKIINEARNRGYVRISLNTPLAPCLELEAKLKQAFDLHDAVVVPSPEDEEDVRTVVGLAAGDYLSTALEKGQILGLGWGGTVHAAARSLEPRVGAGNVVVSLCGGLAKSASVNPYDNAAIFARILDAECYYITAPMIADNPSTKKALMDSAPIRAVLDIARKVDIALLTAVDLSPKSRIMKYGVLSEEAFQSLVEAGAVGNICDYYLDADGNLLDHAINERTISVPLDIVRLIPRTVLAAGGGFKVPIIRAILKAGLCSVLITDEAAAGLLLKDTGR